MSTRANIILQDGGKSKLIFYKHSDGYPEGVMPLLEKFMGWAKSGQIRDNVGQAGGWLIVLGAMEYNAIPPFKVDKPAFEGATPYGLIETFDSPDDWKVGSIEPTTGIHGDIEYLYIVDLKTKEITVKEDWTGKEFK